MLSDGLCRATAYVEQWEEETGSFSLVRPKIQSSGSCHAKVRTAQKGSDLPGTRLDVHYSHHLARKNYCTILDPRDYIPMEIRIWEGIEAKVG